MDNLEPKYIFSYYKQIKIPKIKRRPWWNLFGKDTIIYANDWKWIHHIIDKSTADIITTDSKTFLTKDLYKIMFDDEVVCRFQLEITNSIPNAYTPTSNSIEN